MTAPSLALLAVLLPVAGPFRAGIAPARPAAAVAEARERIFVGRLGAVRVAEDLAAVLTDLLVHELSGCADCEVLSAHELKAMLNKAALDQTLGCSDPRCQVDLAQAAAAPYLVAGSVARVETQYLITLELVDVAAAQVVRRVQAKVRGTEGDLLALMEEAAPRLLTGEGRLRGEVAAAAGERAAAVAEFMGVAQDYEQGAREYLDERTLVSRLHERLAERKKASHRGKVRLKKVKARGRK